jgi:L-threonylcarbamoyladenylate synthase
VVSSWHLRCGSRALAGGGVIIYPTEGVFGLGCRFDDPDAVKRVLRLKGREYNKGLIILINSLAQVEGLLDLRRVDPEVLNVTWPGPVTWVIPASPHAPHWLTGGQSGLAVRQSAHPLVKHLTGRVGPLVSTSANPSGRAPARTLLRARRYFPQGVDYFIPGDLGGARGPTEIRDAVSGSVLRKGG